MEQCNADGGHEQDEGYCRLLGRPNGAPASQPTLMPLQVFRSELAMALKPPLMLIQVLLCPGGYVFRADHDPFNGGNFRSNEIGYV